ncbi:MAG: uroporphyrinogen decarboxylase [Rhodospirillales bacterium]|nr:uroporphyrinogen decarboxylase [Rhodospirillales bacterium]
MEFREGEGPVLEPIRTVADIARLEGGLDRFNARIAPVFETVRRVAQALPLDTALIGFAGAPWTVATYMIEGGTSRDFATVRRFAYSDPVGFGRLIDLLVEATIHYLSEQIKAGAEAVKLFDSWAGVLPPAEFRRWAIEPVQKIVSALRMRHPAVPIIAFPRGAGVNYRFFAETAGVDAIGFDPTVPLDWAAAAIQPRATLQGNLDPILLVVGGRPMEIATLHILETLAGKPFVFNLGHGIVPETPPENVARLCHLIRHWRC